MNMKLKFLLGTLLVVCFSCDQYKEDTPVVIDYTAKFVPNEPVVVSLKSFISPSTSNNFSITHNPSVGIATVIKDSFLKYIPEATEDRLKLDVFDKNGKFLAKANIKLVPTSSPCGIGFVDSYTLHEGESIAERVLVSEETICEHIGSAFLAVTPVENTEGLVFTIPPPGPNHNPIQLILSYNPPEGFKGSVKALYSLGLNVKEEFMEEYSNLLYAEDLIKHPEYFNFFISAMIEIEVVE